MSSPSIRYAIAEFQARMDAEASLYTREDAPKCKAGNKPCGSRCISMLEKCKVGSGGLGSVVKKAVGRSVEAVKDDFRLIGGKTGNLSQERRQSLGEVKSGIGGVAKAAKNVVKRSVTAVEDDAKVIGAIAKSVAT